MSDRNLTEDALRESEAKYRHLIDSLHAGVVVHAPDTRILLSNATASEILGLTPDQLLGKAAIDPAWHFVHEDGTVLPVEEYPVNQVLSTGNPLKNFVGGLNRPSDSALVWVLVNAFPEFDAHHQLQQIVVTFIDITDRKRAAEELRRTAVTNQVILNAIPDLILRVSRDGIYRDGIPTPEVPLLVPPNEFIGKSLWELLPADLAQQRMAAIEQAFQTGMTQIHEYQFFMNGELRYEESRIVVSGEDEVMILVRDISDRKRAEAALRDNEHRYAQILDSVQDMVFCKAPGSVVLYANQAACNYYQMTLEQLRGITDVPFNQIDYTQQYIQDDLQVFTTGKPVEVLEEPNQNSDGEVHYFHTIKSPIFDAEGNVIELVGVSRDITEQKRAEQERERLLERERLAREEAEAANRIKDEFLAVLSHELRSPLNPILGWAQLLQSQPLDEEKTKHALAAIERNAKLQTRLIEDLLDVSRILQGKLVLNTLPVNLISTIEATLETVSLAVEAKGIQIQQVIDPSVGEVIGDSTRLQQVVWNLLSNAVKFTPPGGTIEIRLERINAHAQIQVRDTGKGIDAEFLPHVFEYFRQEDATTTRKFGGLGLGLAIVRHLTELHGGTVWAESPGEGLGTTFTIRLPLMPDSSTTLPNSRLQVDPVVHLSGLRILVVDDEPDIRELVAFILKDAGAEVSIADSALEALSLMEQQWPDVLVCDIGMPDMDGYRLMHQIRTKLDGQILSRHNTHLIGIALTAYAREIDQNRALEVGFQRHITKPVEPDELVRAIALAVQSSGNGA